MLPAFAPALLHFLPPAVQPLYATWTSPMWMGDWSTPMLFELVHETLPRLDSSSACPLLPLTVVFVPMPSFSSYLPSWVADVSLHVLLVYPPSYLPSAFFASFLHS